ncbi:hypothetical protein [Streptomyces sp. AS02]|uniref:hypothetical protein n=1 Tax=Streptomyces sp. AS02 TaxID=2938946 RepID=UPI00202180D9|nr:hypothetical protein [Streptomyces sp. AS02]MCL8016260.1 hypothetical protein [Streptomyces sp. AS02]
MAKGNRVLVVGGYGTVGMLISDLIARRYPDVDVVVGGRRFFAAEAAARLHGLAGAVRVDVTDEDPLADVDPLPDAVLVALNDHNDRLLHSAARRGIPLIDIARWLVRIEDAHRTLAREAVTAPVVLASGWMASAAPVTAAAYGWGAPADHVDIDILLSLKDKTGPDSATGFVDVHLPFELWEQGETRTVRGVSEPRTVTFSNGRTRSCRLFSSPEQATLVTAGHARGVSVRMAFDNRPTNSAFTALVNSGLWARLSRERRFGILHNPGAKDGAPHEFVVTIKNGLAIRRILVKDPEGQAHLTAASAVTQLERVLGLNGRDRPNPGISFPEDAKDVMVDVAAMESMGVQFTELSRSQAASAASAAPAA